jgi:cellulose synthase/poly-beta-1,6-N-acetylglucosamine synthase-like glycosyltransferase
MRVFCRRLQFLTNVLRFYRKKDRTDTAGCTPSLSPTQGDRVSNKSLTIVLPIHNGEARLRTCVGQLLELASELTTRFSVLIIDDGSTDATFEVAEELAALYPQVLVQRHNHRRGLGPTIEYAQRRIRSDAVIVHDGITPIDPNQVRNLWRNCLRESAALESSTANAAAMQSAICDFANLPAIHAAMEQAHHRVLGFQWITPLPAELAEPLRERTNVSDERTVAPHFTRRASMGRIPALPRPKFLSAVAEFALGE